MSTTLGKRCLRYHAFGRIFRHIHHKILLVLGLIFRWDCKSFSDLIYSVERHQPKSVSFLRSAAGGCSSDSARAQKLEPYKYFAAPRPLVLPEMDSFSAALSAVLDQLASVKAQDWPVDKIISSLHPFSPLHRSWENLPRYSIRARKTGRMAEYDRVFDPGDAVELVHAGWLRSSPDQSCWAVAVGLMPHVPPEQRPIIIHPQFPHWTRPCDAVEFFVVPQKVVSAQTYEYAGFLPDKAAWLFQQYQLHLAQPQHADPKETFESFALTYLEEFDVDDISPQHPDFEAAYFERVGISRSIANLWKKIFIHPADEHLVNRHPRDWFMCIFRMALWFLHELATLSRERNMRRWGFHSQQVQSFSPPVSLSSSNPPFSSSEPPSSPEE